MYFSQEFCGEQSELVKQQQKKKKKKKNELEPYDHMNGFEKTDDSKLPRKEEFYSLLRDEQVSDKGYERAKKRFK